MRLQFKIMDLILVSLPNQLFWFYGIENEEFFLQFNVAIDVVLLHNQRSYAFNLFTPILLYFSIQNIIPLQILQRTYYGRS